MKSPPLPLRAHGALVGLGLTGILALALAYPTDKLVASMFESEGQLETAISYYERWTTRHPTDRETRWKMADLLLMTVNPTRAIEVMEAMQRDWPDDAAIAERLVEIEDSLLRVDQSIARLQALARLKPDDATVTRRLADHYRWRGDSERLVETLLKLVDSATPAEHAELVEILLANQRYEELIRYFTVQVQKQPDSIAHRLALYEAYLRSHQLDRALEQMRAVLALAPAKLEPLRELASQLVALGRLEEAIALYNERLAADPLNAQLATDLGELYEAHAERLLAAGKQREAIALFERRIRQEPRRVDLRLGLAELYGKKANEMAVRQMEELLEIAPDSVEAWATHGERLGWLGRAQEAVPSLKRALILAPDNLGIRRKLAQHLAWSGQPAEAVAEYRTVVERTNAPADKADLVEALVAVEKAGEALPIAQSMVHSAPENLRYRRLLAEAAIEASRCDLALGELRWLTRRQPADRDAWGQLGLCANALGNEDEAMNALSMARKLRSRPAARSREQ